MVSSSVFRGVAKSAVGSSTTIKIPKGMGYGGRESTVDPKYLAPKNTPIEETLLETNNILVEIQKQLSLDFAYRIAKEKNDANKIRAASDKEKRSKKEKNLESNKIVKSLGGVTNKVLAPAKGIFEKILDFLAAIGTGFLVNKALTWLSDEENRKKIEGVFNFVKDNWKWILGIIGGVLIGRVVYKVLRIFRALRSVARFLNPFKGKPSGPGPSRPGTGGRPKITTSGGGPAGRPRVTTSGGGPAGRPDLRNPLRQRPKVTTGRGAGNIVQQSIRRVSGLAKEAGKNVVGKLGLKGITKFLRPILKRIPIFGGLIDFAVSMALGEPIGRAAAKAVGAMLGGALGTLIPFPGVGTFLGGWAGDWVGGTLYDWIVGAKKDQKIEKESAEEGADQKNRGGTVTGKDVGNKDSVLTHLTVGEKVVPREQSKPKKFGPFIDDIIRDKGSLYGGMVVALREQEENNQLFKKTNESFEKTIKELSEKNKSRPRRISSGGGTPSPSPSPSPSSSNTIKPTGKDSTLSLKKKEDGGPETIMLPMQKSDSNRPLSEAAMSSGSGGSSIPIFGAEDPENTYIEYMKMQFGIFGA